MKARILCISAACVLLAGLVVADIAMPRDKWSPVRMASESVKIDVTASKVTVEATFVLENTKGAETIVVGYPRGVLEKSLDDFTATVDGEKLEVASQPAKKSGVPDFGGSSREKDGALKPAYQFDGPYPEWKTFKVKFDAGQKRTVVVKYSVAPAEVETEKGKLLTYVYTLKTGATWAGNIDEANIEMSYSGVEIASTTPAGPKQKLESMKPSLLWTFKNFKPTQDIEVTFKATK